MSTRSSDETSSTELRGNSAVGILASRHLPSHHAPCYGTLICQLGTWRGAWRECGGAAVFRGPCCPSHHDGCTHGYKSIQDEWERPGYHLPAIANADWWDGTPTGARSKRLWYLTALKTVGEAILSANLKFWRHTHNTVEKTAFPSYRSWSRLKIGHCQSYQKKKAPAYQLAGRRIKVGKSWDHGGGDTNPSPRDVSVGEPQMPTDMRRRSHSKHAVWPRLCRRRKPASYAWVSQGVWLRRPSCRGRICHRCKSLITCNKPQHQAQHQLLVMKSPRDSRRADKKSWGAKKRPPLSKFRAPSNN